MVGKEGVKLSVKMNESTMRMEQGDMQCQPFQKNLQQLGTLCLGDRGRRAPKASFSLDIPVVLKLS
jgi:hypothetical protein